MIRHIVARRLSKKQKAAHFIQSQYPDSSNQELLYEQEELLGEAGVLVLAVGLELHSVSGGHPEGEGLRPAQSVLGRVVEVAVVEGLKGEKNIKIMIKTFATLVKAVPCSSFR